MSPSFSFFSGSMFFHAAAASNAALMLQLVG
jgi:hypothetical protein